MADTKPAAILSAKPARAIRDALMRPLPFAALIALGIIFACALFAPFLTPYGPDRMDLSAILAPPSGHHIFGTDYLGRDLWTRVIYGARPSLLAGFGIVAIGTSAGLLIGSLSGLIGGYVDMLIMRVMDVMLALPGLVVALALTAALGPNLVNAVIALAILSIPAYTRMVRGQALALRELDFIKAAQSMGGHSLYIVLQHVIPNVLPSLVVFMTFHLGGAILASSALSFIGLGMQPPNAEWGAIIGEARSTILVAWWGCMAPGIAIVSTALALNIIGDALRDGLDPRTSASG
jgi:peptide/nickel transport system permease protein